MILRRNWLAAPVALALAATLSVANAAPKPQVLVRTSLGAFTLELEPELAPKTVANFLQYVRDKHYDGLIFHRVIGNFMLQGGGYNAQFQEKPTRAPVPNEARSAYAGGLRHLSGTLAMARTANPDSATAQFFINVKNNAFLEPTPIPAGDPVARFEYRGEVYENVPRARLLGASQLAGYTVFGRVIDGMDTIEKIRTTPTGAGGPFPTDVPKTQVLIQSATLLP